MRKMRLLALLSLPICLDALASDAIIELAPGSSFVIKDSSGSKQLMSVTQDGELLVNGKRADFTAPTIEIAATTVATSCNHPYSVTFKDDVGLGFYFIDGVSKPIDSPDLEVTIDSTASIGLSEGSKTQTVVVSDASGNVTKESFTVTAPSTNLAFGDYKVVGGEYAYPAGFACVSEPMWSPYEAMSVKSAKLDAPQGYNDCWSAQSGFKPWLILDRGESLVPDDPIGLNATAYSWSGAAGQGSAYMNDGWYQYSYSIAGRVEALDGSDPARMRVDVQMTCVVNDVESQGVPASFIIERIE